MKQSIIEGFNNILNDLSKNPGTSQRELALRNGISLGKVNSSIKYLLRQGFLEVQSSVGTHNRRRYFYYLTPAGKFEQAKQASNVIRIKKKEFDRISRELKDLENDIIDKLDRKIASEVGKD